MINLYTIGFTKKPARVFFDLLIKNNVKKVIDVRLNNKSQLAGFAKKGDLEYFLKEIAGIEYYHMEELSPTKELLDGYKQNKIPWSGYEKRYLDTLKNRDILNKIDFHFLDDSCLLCSESSPKHCHRRILSEYLLKKHKDINIIDL